jgi:hypothetical protein
MIRNSFAALLAALFSVALVGPASAAVISITHAKAVNPGIGPGDTAGYPITITQPGSYRLDTNLTVPANRAGIVITTHDVTIDLNGFRLHGLGAALFGISIAGSGQPANTVTIRNGRIVGFKRNAIRGNHFWRVEDMQVLFNGGTSAPYYSGVVLGDSCIVRGSTISDSSLDGIKGGNDCLIENNVLRNNGRTRGGFGVGIFSGTVLGNTIAHNEWGIFNYGGGVIGYGNNTLYDNQTQQVSSGVVRLQPNACNPACP